MAISPKLKKKIGTKLKAADVEVDKSQIRRFALAIGEDSAIHFDVAAAKKAGFPSLVGPPSFASVLIDLDPLLAELEMDPIATMHAEEEYDYFRPICAGDVLKISTVVADIKEKQTPNGRLIFAVIESSAEDKKGRKVFKGRRVMVEKKK